MKEKNKITCLIIVAVLVLLGVIFGEGIFWVLITLGGMAFLVYTSHASREQGKKEMENLYWDHLDGHQTYRVSRLGCPFCRIEKEYKR